MTYSARQYQPLTVALQAAVSRGVHVSVVVETLQGAGSALAGDEPYQAFTGIAGIDLWHWPSAKRTEPGAKMHAKLAVADRCVLFVTSANLTQSGVGKNIRQACSSAADRATPRRRTRRRPPRRRSPFPPQLTSTVDCMPDRPPSHQGGQGPARSGRRRQAICR